MVGEGGREGGRERSRLGILLKDCARGDGCGCWGGCVGPAASAGWTLTCRDTAAATAAAAAATDSALMAANLHLLPAPPPLPELRFLLHVLKHLQPPMLPILPQVLLVR